MDEQERINSLQARKAARRERFLRKRGYIGGIVSVISVAALLIVFFVMIVCMDFLKRPTISESERRELASFPEFSWSSFWSGEYTSGIVHWFSDTVPNREALVSRGTHMKSLFGFTTENTMHFVNTDIAADANQGNEKGEKTPSEGETPEDTTEPTKPPKDYTSKDAEFEISNGLLVVFEDEHWRCLPLFGGGSGDSYVEALNLMRAGLDESVNIYSVPIPLSSEFYTPSNAQSYTVSQADSFKKIAGRLSPGITSVDLIPVMKQHVEEPIYTRTDHHWEGLGAYYACQEIAKICNVPFADISQYNKQVVDGYVGSLYTFSGDDNLLNDPEEFVYYMPKCKYTTYYYDSEFEFQFEGSYFIETDTPNSYLKYMGSDVNIVKITTSVNNGRKLMILKDSYGNAMPPFFTSSFSEIYVVDERYVDRNIISFIKGNGITDVAVCSCAYSLYSGNADDLLDNVKNNPADVVVDPMPTATEATAAETATPKDGDAN